MTAGGGTLQFTLRIRRFIACRSPQLYAPPIVRAVMNHGTRGDPQRSRLPRRGAEVMQARPTSKLIAPNKPEALTAFEASFHAVRRKPLVARGRFS